METEALIMNLFAEMGTQAIQHVSMDKMFNLAKNQIAPFDEDVALAHFNQCPQCAMEFSDLSRLVATLNRSQGEYYDFSRAIAEFEELENYRKNKTLTDEIYHACRITKKPYAQFKKSLTFHELVISLNDFIKDISINSQLKHVFAAAAKTADNPELFRIEREHDAFLMSVVINEDHSLNINVGCRFQVIGRLITISLGGISKETRFGEVEEDINNDDEYCVATANFKAEEVNTALKGRNSESISKLINIAMLNQS